MTIKSNNSIAFIIYMIYNISISRVLVLGQHLVELVLQLLVLFDHLLAELYSLGMVVVMMWVIRVMLVVYVCIRNVVLSFNLCILL